ncbi:unnamed protein product [Ilex paraguariensis]
MIGLVSPVLAIREMGSILEVNLITGLSKSFTLHQVFSVLQQEGAEVVSASSSTVGVRVFYTIYSQALSSRIGIATSRISERLHQLINNPVA